MGSPSYCDMGSHLCRCRLHIWSEAPTLSQHDCMRSSTTQWGRCLLLRALNVVPVGTETELSVGERHGSWRDFLVTSILNNISESSYPCSFFTACFWHCFPYKSLSLSSPHRTQQVTSTLLELSAWQGHSWPCK